MAILEMNHVRAEGIADLLPRLAGYGDKSIDPLLRQIMSALLRDRALADSGGFGPRGRTRVGTY